MANKVQSYKVAILATDGFEQVELTEPRKALQQEGAEVDLISPKEGKIKGWQHVNWGDEFPVDVSLSDADADDYDALMLPGGVMNPDKLRMNDEAVKFVRSFIEAGKPIAAICHAPWTLINAGGVRGRRVTSWPSLKADLINAGANWVDEPAVRDGLLLTSRKPDDIPDFNAAMIKLFDESRRQEEQAASFENPAF